MELVSKEKRAYVLAWVTETAVGFLLFAIVFGQVAMPMFNDVSTAGWNTYAVVLWVLLPLFAIVSFAIRVVDSAKRGYVGPISGY